MYQRYYKQRKIGRIASVMLVFGSGTVQAARNIYSSTLGKLNVNTLREHSSYLPQNIAEIIKGDSDKISQEAVQKEVEYAQISNNLRLLKENPVQKFELNSFPETEMKEVYKCYSFLIGNKNDNYKFIYKIVTLFPYKTCLK